MTLYYLLGIVNPAQMGVVGQFAREKTGPVMLSQDEAEVKTLASPGSRRRFFGLQPQNDRPALSRGQMRRIETDPLLKWE